MLPVNTNDLKPALEARLDELDSAARVFGFQLLNEGTQIVPVDGIPDPAASETSTGHQFKDIAYKVLEDAYPNPVRAPDLQMKVEAILGRKFHDKTAGITLYRFSLDGVVTRNGRLWLFVPKDNRQQRIPSPDRDPFDIFETEQEAS